MIIPRLDQSVGLDAPQIPAQRAPSVVPGAFGEDVGAAVQKAGEAGVQLADVVSRHIAQQNYWKGQAAVATQALNVRTTFQDMATSTEPMQTLSPGQSPSNTSPYTPPTTDQESKIGQPKGYLNRVGFGADGSTAEFIKNAAPMRDDFIGQFKSDPRLTDEATKRFDSIYASYYDQVSKHEATQYRLGMNNSFNADTVSSVNVAASANNPKSLLAGIDAIKAATTSQYQYKGAEDQEINNNIQNNVANAVSKAVINKLQSTADLGQAKEMLDAAKDQMSPDRYEKIDTMITTGYQRLQQQSQVASVQKEISGQANLLTQFASGKGGWMNIDDVSSLVQQGTVSAKFAKAYTDVISAKGNFQPRSEQNQNTPKFIDAIYNAKDQTQLHDTLISMMQQHKDMSQEEMSILINSAMKRSGNLPLDLKFSSAAQNDPKQFNVDAGARAIVNFGRRNQLSPDEISFMYGNYYSHASKGMDVKDAVDQATRQYAVAKYPAVATMEGTPTAIASPTSGVKYLHFNSNTTVEPARVWNPKTGVFDVNTNRAQTAKGDK